MEWDKKEIRTMNKKETKKEKVKFHKGNTKYKRN